MTCINITKFVLIKYLEKDHNMIKTRRLKMAVVSIQTILGFVLSRTIFFCMPCWEFWGTPQRNMVLVQIIINLMMYVNSYSFLRNMPIYYPSGKYQISIRFLRVLVQSIFRVSCRLLVIAQPIKYPF